jgi:hypothetical protein
MERYREPNPSDAYEMAIAGRLGEFMTDDKVAKPKQTGMALEMDVIKKIGHQLGRVPPGAEDRILAFVKDWSQKQSISGNFTAAGQLPLAVDKKDFFE